MCKEHGILKKHRTFICFPSEVQASCTTSGCPFQMASTLLRRNTVLFLYPGVPTGMLVEESNHLILYNEEEETQENIVKPHFF